MAVSVDSISLSNPNPNPSSALKLKAPSMAVSGSLRFQSLLRPRSYRLSFVSPVVLGSGIVSVNRRTHLKHSVVSFAAASHEESKHSEIEVEKEKNDLRLETEESEEAWKEALDAFKEQALKMQSLSQEAYEIYSKRAVIVLKETSEQLKIQADRAKHDLTVIAKEISDEGKEYLATAAENSPDEFKDIVETFSPSNDDLKDISKVRDFHLGIPYGAYLSLGGFLSFMLTGSISGIRFGVILGGILLALSISSLRSWKKGESSSPALKGQTAIAGILFLKDVSSLFQKLSLHRYFAALISGAMLAFYLYRNTVSTSENAHGAGNDRLNQNGAENDRLNFDHGAES